MLSLGIRMGFDEYFGVELVTDLSKRKFIDHSHLADEYIDALPPLPKGKYSSRPYKWQFYEGGWMDGCSTGITACGGTRGGKPSPGCKDRLFSFQGFGCKTYHYGDIEVDFEEIQSITLKFLQDKTGLTTDASQEVYIKIKNPQTVDNE